MPINAMLTTKKNRQSKSCSWKMTAATLLTLAATMLVQSSNASIINSNGALGSIESRQMDLFENVDGNMMMEKRISFSSSVSLEHASWISKALKLAGTYSPSVSTIAGKATSSSKATTTAKTTSTTAKTTSTTAKSTTAPNNKVTVSSHSTSSVKSTSSMKTTVTVTGAVFPTAKSISTTSAKMTTSTQRPKTETWSWAAGAYGCGTSSPSGRALLCYATGTAQAKHKRSPEATAAPIIEARQNNDQRGEQSYFRRADTNQTTNASQDTNDNSPDLGWLDTVVGAVPYRKGDLISSIVWIVMTLLLVPLFLIRILKRSSLVAHSLVCVFFWICALVAAFVLRVLMVTGTPTTTSMIAENILLQVLPCLLLDPLFNLLSMYSSQGEFKSGVPSVCLLLRLLNVVALGLFAATAAYTGIYMDKWDHALMSPMASGARDAFPTYLPATITRLGPIVGSFIMLAAIAGGLLLIPVARGATGSMRPGGFLAVLFTLIGISVTYRVLQSLHAQDTLTSDAEAEASSSAKEVVSTTLLQLASASVVKIANIAPPGMFSINVKGIDWSKLQSTMASRGLPQSPLVFNLIYVFPMWLQVFLLFFVHAPGGDQSANLKAKALEA